VNVLLVIVVTQRHRVSYVHVEESFIRESAQSLTLVAVPPPKNSDNSSLSAFSKNSTSQGANYSHDASEIKKRTLSGVGNKTSQVSRKDGGARIPNSVVSATVSHINAGADDGSLLFPSNMTDTTLLLSPPQDTPFHFVEFPEVLTDKSINIFDLLARWDKTDLPFFSKTVPPLRFPDSYSEDIPPPDSKFCKLSNFAKYHWRVVECLNRIREVTPFEQNGNHILFTLRTTAAYHSSRLPVLFQTWLANVNRSNVVIVTDGFDPVLQYRAEEAGLRALISVPGYERLCEKAGDEVSLMFLPENKHYEWFCHVDDDMYVNLEMLVDVLARLKRDKPVYFGRSGTYPGKPRRVMKESKIGTPGTPYNFAVGGMYCLNRVFLNMARRWIGGRDAFKKMCSLVKEPEDVTVGIVAAILLGLDISHTELIRSHGLELYYADPTTLKYQIAISYGYGMVHWGSNPHNVVPVPKHLFTITEDPSQFLSLHCHYHSAVGWCANKLARVHKGQRASSQVHKPSSNSLPL
jgi:fringe protein